MEGAARLILSRSAKTAFSNSIVPYSTRPSLPLLPSSALYFWTLLDERTNPRKNTVCPPVNHRSSMGLTGFFYSSLDEAPPPFPNPSAHVEFYKKFQREVDEYDNDFIKKYNDEANTALIFVSCSPLPRQRFECQPKHCLSDRLVCFLSSHPLSSSMFRPSSNRITHK